MPETPRPRPSSAPLVLLLLKAPRAGNVKTRLAARLGDERATDIYRGMVERQLRAIPPEWNVEIHFTPADAEPEFREWLGPGHTLRAQCDGDLGRRLRKAFAAAFARKATAVLAIGGDCPELDSATLMEAVSRLGRADLVVGPARDGGYYLLGLRQPAPQLFEDIPWSSPKVLSTTLARAQAAGISRELLAPKPDVDDLAAYKTYLAAAARGSSADRVAIIVPALNEAEQIGATLRSARRCFPSSPLLVVDGHSSDRTREIAAKHGARVLLSPRGRGRQCRTGASAIHDADWLLFLHADTQLPDNADDAVARFIASPRAQVATFRLAFDDPGLFLRTCAWCTRFDSVFTRFGDQGILIRREFYDALGGFPDWPLFEDVALLQRARAATRVRSLGVAVTTSARRFQRIGVWRQQVLNARLLVRYLWGESPAALAVEYQAARATAPDEVAAGLQTPSEPSP